MPMYIHFMESHTSHVKHIAMIDEICFQNKSKIKAITSIKKMWQTSPWSSNNRNSSWYTDLKPQAKVTGGQFPRERSARYLKLQLTLGWQTWLHITCSIRVRNVSGSSPHLKTTVSSSKDFLPDCPWLTKVHSRSPYVLFCHAFLYAFFQSISYYRHLYTDSLLWFNMS